MSRELNSLVLDHPLWIRWSHAIYLLMLVMFAFFLFLPWMQTVSGEGRVIAYDSQERRQELSAPIEGRLKTWFVKEGDRVKKGDRIAEISDNDPMILERMAKEREALEKKFSAIELARKTSTNNVHRQKELLEQGLSSRRQYELAKMEQAKLESDEAAALADMSRIDVRLSRQEQQIIIAPVDGVVVRILKNSVAGVDYVKPGDSLAVLVPETSSRVVEVWIAGNDISWVKKNQQVALQFEGWPSVQFSGLPQISVGVFGGTVKLVDAIDDGHGNFRILVEPKDEARWPSAEYLRQGVRAHAWVQLGDVPLGYEIWRQFNRFPPSALPEEAYSNDKSIPSKKNE